MVQTGVLSLRGAAFPKTSGANAFAFSVLILAI
jgi:hypothetical protein